MRALRCKTCGLLNASERRNHQDGDPCAFCHGYDTKVITIQRLD